MRTAPMLVAALALAALAKVAAAEVFTWELPTRYADNSPIALKDRAALVTQIFVGAGPAGPWVRIGTSFPGATSLEAAALRNRYYAARCGWDNTVSDFSEPVSYGREGPNSD